MRKSQILENYTYAVVCAGGKTGSKIVHSLLQAGKKVRAIDINPTSLSRLQNKGTQTCIGSLTDREFLKRSLEGIRAIFLMIPPVNQIENYETFQHEVAESLASAVHFHHIPFAVNLSICGAEIDAAPRVFRSLFHFECLLKDIPHLNVVNIRAAYFMENLLSWMHLIKESGMFGSPFWPKLSIPMISIHDVARKSFQLLLHLAFRGKQTLTLLGNQRMNMEQVSELLGKHLRNEHLPYVCIPYRDAKRTMLASGVSNHMADLYLEMYEKINEGIVLSNIVHRNNEGSLISMEDFIKNTFLPLYQQKQQS